MEAVCHRCNSQIPDGQDFCPSCYQGVDDGSKAARDQTQRSKLSVLMFLSEDSADYYERIPIFFGRPPGYRVKTCFFAETVDAFTEMTKNSAGKWDLLLIDAKIATVHTGSVMSFLDANPRTTIGVRHPPGERNFAERLAPRSCVHFVKPSTQSAWLEIMDRLFTAVESRPHHEQLP